MRSSEDEGEPADVLVDDLAPLERDVEPVARGAPLAEDGARAADVDADETGRRRGVRRMSTRHARRVTSADHRSRGRGVDNHQQIELSPRDEHPNKEIRRALREAKRDGWEIERKRGHAWGVARCGAGCKISIFSTPKSAENHADQIRRALKRCPHRSENS